VPKLWKLLEFRVGHGLFISKLITFISRQVLNLVFRGHILPFVFEVVHSIRSCEVFLKLYTETHVFVHIKH